MSKEFIITEGDIDQTLNLMLAERSRSSFLVTESDIELQFELMLLEQDDDGDGKTADPEVIKKNIMLEKLEPSERLLDNAQKVLDIIGIGTAIPFLPAMLVAYGATILSLMLNIHRKKYAWALFDAFSLIPLAGAGLKMVKTYLHVIKSIKAADDLLVDLIPEETMKKIIEAPIPSSLAKVLPEGSEAKGFVDAILSIMTGPKLMSFHRAPLMRYWESLKKTYEEGGFKNTPEARATNRAKYAERYPAAAEEAAAEDAAEDYVKREKIDIRDYEWINPQASGSVDWLSDFKFKGSLDKSFGPLKAMFIEMFTFYRLARALLKKGDSLVLEGEGYDKNSFFQDFVIPKEGEWGEFITALSIMSATDPEGDFDDPDGDNSEPKKAFEKMAAELEEKKKSLDDNPDLIKKFNALKDESLERMQDALKKLRTIANDDKTETLQEGMLHSITIDFSEIRRKQKHLDESFLVMFGGWVKWLLEKMFGGASIPGNIKGSKSEVESFARAMGSEKRYIETAKRYGLDHPTTYKSKAKLSAATKGFEKETGIKWPFE